MADKFSYKVNVALDEETFRALERRMHAEQERCLRSTTTIASVAREALQNDVKNRGE